MEIGKLHEFLERVPNQGLSLSLPEAIRIECSLRLLQDQIRSEGIYFLGKLLGISNDYYLAFSTLHNNIFPSNFFCSIDSINWVSLTKVEKSLKEEAIHIRNQFTGKLISEFELPSGRLISEEQRLSAFLEDLNSRCLIFPRGYLIQTALNFTILNPLWNGIEIKIANRLSNYRHWIPKSKPLTLLEKSLSNPALDFTDSLEDIENWRFIESADLNDIQLRSKIWPGFLFSLNNTDFCNCYFGYGIYEGDLFEKKI